jgi:hypothetical protein
VSDAPDPPPPDRSPGGAPPEPEWQRRRRLARVFGDVLPETTSDERDAAVPREDAGEAWLKAQVPPHHGS